MGKEGRVKLTVGKKKKKPLKKKSKLLGERESKRVKKRKKKKADANAFVQPTAKAAKKRLEEEGAGELWKPRDGLNTIVMLPSTRAMGISGDFPWIETRSHFIGGEQAMTALGIERPDDFPMAVGCAKHHEKRTCGWCEFQQKLRQSRHARDKKLSRALFNTLSCFANIVDMRQPKVVRQWRFGRRVETELLVALESGINFVDPDDLMKINIRRIKTGKQDWNVEYKVNVLQHKTVGPIKTVWKKNMEDLSKFINPVQSPSEYQETMDLLLAAAEAEGEDVDLEADYDDDDDDDDVDF